MKTSEIRFTEISNKGKDFAAAVLLLFITIQYFSPLFFDHRTLFFRDNSSVMYPMRYFLYQSFHEGILPFWNPSVNNGTSFLAGLYSGVFYPPDLIFFLNDFTLAFNLFFVGHFILLALSVYVLMRFSGVSSGAALCAAVTAQLSGYFLALQGTSTHFLAIVWLPSIFFCFQKYLADNKPAYLLGTVICIVCQILASGPDVCLATVLLLYVHSLALGPINNSVLHCTLKLSVVLVLAAGLTAPQLLPTYALAGESFRSGGLTFGYHTHWSMSPDSLLTLILPKDHTDFMVRIPSEQFTFLQSFHMGLFGALFLFASVFFLKRREVRFWIAVFFAGIFFALGEHNPLYRYFYDWVPLWKLFRYPEKFYFFAAFAQVFLVGYGVDKLIRRQKSTLVIVFTGLFLVLAILGVSYFEPDRNPLPSLALLGVFCTLCYLFHRDIINPSVLKLVLLVLIFFDLTLKHYMLVPMIDKKFYEDEPAVIKTLKQTKQDMRSFRVYSGNLTGDPRAMTIPSDTNNYLLAQTHLKERLRPYRGLTYGVMSPPEGLSDLSLDSRDTWLWPEILSKSSLERRLRILKRSNVRYVVKEDASTIQLQELDGALPRVFLVPKYRIAKDPQLLNIYYDETFDPTQEVLLSEPVGMQVANDFAGSIEDVQYETNRVVVRSRQNGNGFLVLLDSWFPGWSATVDEKPEHIFQANHFYRAVKTGTGEHIVVFTFEPVGFHTGIWIFAATLLTLVSYLILTTRRTINK